MEPDTQIDLSAGARSRSDQIAGLLEEQILTGRFPPGARLDEAIKRNRQAAEALDRAVREVLAR